MGGETDHEVGSETASVEKLQPSVREENLQQQMRKRDQKMHVLRAKQLNRT
jgi:hypothetical protein